MPGHSRSSAEQLVHALIFAPIGRGAKFVDDLPDNLAKASQQVEMARFIGKLAIDQGTKSLRRHLAPSTTGDEASEDSAGAPATGSSADDEASDRVENVIVASPSTPTVDGSDSENPETDATAVTSAELALPDYDHLPAAHIVGKLAGLTADERNDLESYERSHRHRRTVLGKLDQLRTV